MATSMFGRSPTEYFNHMVSDVWKLPSYVCIFLRLYVCRYYHRLNQVCTHHWFAQSTHFACQVDWRQTVGDLSRTISLLPKRNWIVEELQLNQTLVGEPSTLHLL